MRERPDRPETEAADHFLVDGVAPSVIGDGPPEPDDAEWEGTGPHAEPEYAAPQEPPTSPIPVLHQPSPEPRQAKRKSWVAKVFGR